jgi:hypothetical protein
MGLFGDNKPKITDKEIKDARLHMDGVSKKDRDLVEGVVRQHGSDKGIDSKGFDASMDWLKQHGRDYGLTDKEREEAEKELRKKL